MFRNLARLIPAPAGLGPAGPAIQVFRVHPLQLSRWLEEAWVAARTVPEFGIRTVNALPFLGSDEIVDVLELPIRPCRPASTRPTSVSSTGRSSAAVCRWSGTTWSTPTCSNAPA
jgi:hypothetical protein